LTGAFCRRCGDHIHPQKTYNDIVKEDMLWTMAHPPDNYFIQWDKCALMLLKAYSYIKIRLF
jgi:hypothetical protein